MKIRRSVLTRGVVAAAVLVAAITPLLGPRDEQTARALRSYGTTAELTPVKVAVIDSGVSIAGADRIRVLPAVACTPTCRPDGPIDVTGHGTQVAAVFSKTLESEIERGQIGAGRQTSTPVVELLPIRVLDESKRLTDKAVAEAIGWARRQGATVANLSVTVGKESGPIERAIRSAPDMVIVTAAGNEGIDIDRQALPAWPCASTAPNLICVAAANRTGQIVSNYGFASVDLAAEAQQLRVEDGKGRTVFVSGSSFAAPQVSAAVAAIVARDPGSSPQQVYDQLRRDSAPTDHSSGKVRLGVLARSSAVDCCE